MIVKINPGRGVEHDHFEHALSALDLAVRYAPIAPDRAIAMALTGFQAFVDIQQTFFREVVKDCKTAIATARATANPVASAR